MLSQKLKRHLQDQNWFAVMIDLVIVILGIVIAFQINRWAEQNRERHAAMEYLGRLEEDLNIEIGQMQDALSFADERIRAVHLLDMASKDSRVAADSLNLPWALETATWRSFPQINAFVYSELQSTGNLSLIRSESLRRALADHYTRIQHYAHVGMDLEAQHRFEALTAGLLSIDELAAIESEQWTGGTSTVSPSRSVEIAEALAQNQAALDLLPSLNQHHIFNKKVITQALDRARSMISEVSQLRNRR